jgi:hypothetical protein
MSKVKTENRLYVSTAIMAGHTTGGENENSDEVTAIPLEKRNGSQRNRRNGARKYCNRKRWQRQEGGN